MNECSSDTEAGSLAAAVESYNAELEAAGAGSGSLSHFLPLKEGSDPGTTGTTTPDPDVGNMFFKHHDYSSAGKYKLLFLS